MTSTIVSPSRWLRHWWPVLLLGCVLALVLGFLGLEWWIQGQAMQMGDDARAHYPGDRVEALVALVESDRPLPTKNRTVWALGQLRDPRALPVLRKHYTGAECDHARFLCQSELRKAINLCEGHGASGWLNRFRLVAQALPAWP